MESKQYRRSISFEILANDSPGDGDSLLAVDSNTIGVEKAENAKSRRRRRKGRSRKSSLGDLSPLAPLGEYLSSSLPASPLSSLHLGRGVPPLEGSLRTMTSNSNLFSPDWRNGDSSTEPSPSTSAFSVDGPPTPASFSWTSNPGPSSQGEIRAKETSNEEAGPSRDTRLPEDLQEPALESEDRSSHSAAAAHPDLLRHASELHDRSPSVASAGNLQMDGGLSEGVLELRQPLQRKPPDFSAASEGLAEPSFIPGTLHPPTELRQRIVEKTSDREGEKSSTRVAHGERNQRPRSESNPSTSADEHGTPPPYKVRLGTFATPQLKDWERLMATNAQLSCY